MWMDEIIQPMCAGRIVEQNGKSIVYFIRTRRFVSTNPPA